MPHRAHAMLQVDVETGEDVTVLRVVGEVDLLTAPILAEAVDSAIAAGAHQLVIDCLDVTYLGSTGIGVLVHAWRETEGRISLKVGDDLQSNVRRVLDLCGLAELLPELLTDGAGDAGDASPGGRPRHEIDAEAAPRS
ncbi:MAG: anti-anti-sigma factor [Acidimicrobiales bacterium]|nr:anti-anti-sigma factor [Acidimicrobiales bacterium]